MRKSFLVAATAALVLGTSGVAQAQTPAPSVDVTASVSPSKSGKTSAPKSEKLKLSVTNNKESKTTAKQIKITFPSTLKVSTKGLDQCTADDTTLLAGPEKVCKSSIAGTGTADAFINPFATTPAPLHFTVTPLVGKNELIFVLDSNIADAVLRAKVKGRTLTIDIPAFLQQPAPGTYSALEGLAVSLSKKKGKNTLISSVGCKSKKHSIGVTVAYAPNPNPPAASSASGKGDAKCS